MNHFWGLFRQEWNYDVEKWTLPFTSFSLGYERMLKSLFVDYALDPLFTSKIVIREFEQFSLKSRKMDHEYFVSSWFDIADSWYVFVNVTL